MTTNMPLVQALMQYIQEAPVPFHMPGHKGGKGFSPFMAKHLLQMDVTEIPGLDNLHYPAGAIAEAQQAAAELYLSDHCYFLTNGSTCGIHAMLLAATKPGDRVLIARNSHKSVWDALVLSGAQPVYIYPEYDYDRELVTQISPQSVKLATEAYPDAVGLLLVHPNYYGMCSDIKQIREILSKQNMLMLVDEAHGAHFAFHPELPLTSGQAGADIWVQSAHKTLPSLTQSAYLHVKGTQIDRGRLTQACRMSQSSSPSYLLMASLDWARAYMESQGRKSLDDLLVLLQHTRQRLHAMNLDAMNFDTMCENHRYEVAEWDPTRLVIDLAHLGISGYEGEKLLRQQGIQVEMSDMRRVVLICTVADTERDFDRLVEGCFMLMKGRTKEKKQQRLNISWEIPRQILSPREAFFRPAIHIPLKMAAGRIASGLIGAYPPGVPRFCPGELIDSVGVEELLAIKVWGGNLFGLLDNDLIPVVAE